MQMADAPSLNPDAPTFCPGNFASGASSDNGSQFAGRIGHASHGNDDRKHGNDTSRGRGGRGRGRRDEGEQRAIRGRFNGSNNGGFGGGTIGGGGGSDVVNNNSRYENGDSISHPNGAGYDPSLPQKQKQPPTGISSTFALNQTGYNPYANSTSVDPYVNSTSADPYNNSVSADPYVNSASADLYAGLGGSVYSSELTSQRTSGDNDASRWTGQSVGYNGINNSRIDNSRGSRGSRRGRGGNDYRGGKRESQQYPQHANRPQQQHSQHHQYSQERYYQPNQYQEPLPYRENAMEIDKADSRSNDVDDSDDETSLEINGKENPISTSLSTGDKQVPTQAGRAGDQVVNPKSQRGRLVEALCRGTYECLVCCVRIKHEARTWSCGSCFNIFHVHCARKWARSPAAASEMPMPPDVGRDDYRRIMGWRCPTCQNVAKDVPNDYLCFCGKVRDPEFDRLETPHSCGEVCGRPRGTGGSLMHASQTSCPHTCTLLCHPGPCPPCTAFVTKACQCGKSKKEVKCSQEAMIQCESECSLPLNCGAHSCSSICHRPPCSKCALRVTTTCCCGQTTQTHDCGPDLPSTFLCDRVCDKKLSCGVEVHRCGEACHPGDCGSCPRLPETVDRCPCGKTPLESVGEGEGGSSPRPPRTSCEDAIPTCGKICGKALACGDHKAKRHLCSAECHEGPCLPCQRKSNVPCFCGATTRKMDCEEMIKKTSIVEAIAARGKLGEEERKFFCDRRCNKKMSCGRHKCGKTCCTLDRDHVCAEKCGKKLTCRRHQCEEPCHKGNCDTCPNVSFDELSCHCGSSVLPPPIHCGTRPPICSEPCRRVHECPHPVSHNCHSDVKCPPCSSLLARLCMGGHQKRSNIPCYLKDVSCGLPCKKPLGECDHLCKKTCHKGPCSATKEGSQEPEPASTGNGVRCTQPCSVTRSDCGHPCNATCHGKTPCPRTTCKIQIRVNCKCGRKSKTIGCPWGASKESHQSFQNLTTQVLASKFKDIQLGNSIDISDLQSTVSSLKVKNFCFSSSSSSPSGTPVPTASTSSSGHSPPPPPPPTVHLECDEDCNAVERNKRFAEALSLENADFSNCVSAEAAAASNSASTYSVFLKEQARKNLQLVSSVEEKIAELVAQVTKNEKMKKTHSFPPMKSHQRQIVHELAEIYGCASVSYDEDPKRNVVVTASKNKASLPPMALTAYVQREMNPRAPVPIPLGSKEEELRSVVAKEKRSTAIPSWSSSGTARTSKPPATDYFDYFDGV